MRFIYLWYAIAIHFAIDYVALAIARFGVLWAELAATAFAAAFYIYLRNTRPSRAF